MEQRVAQNRQELHEYATPRRATSPRRLVCVAEGRGRRARHDALRLKRHALVRRERET
jgi:hypothetical protein